MKLTFNLLSDNGCVYNYNYPINTITRVTNTVIAYFTNELIFKWFSFIKAKKLISEKKLLGVF